MQHFHGFCVKFIRSPRVLSLIVFYFWSVFLKTFGNKRHKKLRIMKTLNKSGNGGLLLTCLLMLSSMLGMAQDGKLAKSLGQDLTKDGFIGFYIIGGILGFGIIAFIIVSMYNKRHQDDDKANIRHIPHHRHHHHHQTNKVVKKSA